MSADTVFRKEISFPSWGTDVEVFGDVWGAGTDDAPRAVVQIVHGMSEHIGRYDHFARFLACRGFAVCGLDHVGHGRSVKDPSKRGHIPARNGRDVLVQNVLKLHDAMRARYGDQVPYFLFGHSMGSFVTRVYICDYADDLAGAVICGTGHVEPQVSKAGHLLARAVARLRGEEHVSELLHRMADGAYSDAVPNARTPLDWLSANAENVDAYMADEACGAPFTAGGYATLTALVADACSAPNIARIPKALPLYFVAGAQDPVGSNGAGVRTAANMARKAGVRDVEVKIYEGMRHEILNETGRDEVYADVLNWLERHLA